MSLNTQPTNQSFLAPNGFQFQIKKTPNVNYFVQKVEMPRVTLGTADAETPFIKLPFPGTKLTFGNLQVTFKVDEDMKNYLEIYNWLKSVGFPDNFAQYTNIAGAALSSGDGVFSDCSLVITTGSKNPNMLVTFYDCFPVDLSEITFDSTAADVDYVTATVTFANRRFEVTPLT